MQLQQLQCSKQSEHGQRKALHSTDCCNIVHCLVLHVLVEFSVIWCDVLMGQSDQV